MDARASALVVVASAAAAFGAGFVYGSRAPAAAGADAEIAGPGVPAAEPARAAKPGAAAAGGDPPSGLEPAAPAAPDREALNLRARELRARAPDLVRSRDARALLRLFRELVALGEAGYVAALEVAEMLREAAEGRDPMGLAIDMEFLWFDRGLVEWSVRHAAEAPAWYRLRSIDALLRFFPDADPPALIRECLATEEDPVWVLEACRRLGDPGASDLPLLSGLAVRHAERESDVTLDLVETISRAPSSAAAMKELAAHPDARVREAVAIARLLLDPPEAGFVVTGARRGGVGPAPGGALRPRDIVVEVGGQPATGHEFELQMPSAYEPGRTLELMVRRDGGLVPVTVTTGELAAMGALRYVRPAR